MSVASSKHSVGATSKAKSEEALEHLASIDLSELCKEAKVERCRATRDLRSCGRYVHYILNTCGHASLCKECSQRCDTCPICRIPILKNDNKLRPRLYYECIEAGLISRSRDERFQDMEDGENQLTADVQRLYTLFDVAMENNLISLVCHYVTDVCMDETAVSSDPVLAFLLDEVVVKDWVKQTFKKILAELRSIYNLEVKEMPTKLGLLLKYSMQLTGISSVLEVLESSFKGTLSAQLQDLLQLQENIIKTKQHIEIMMWCIRNQFLENMSSRYSNMTSWCSHVSERKAAAVRRAWPDVTDISEEPCEQNGSLFIEDALENIDIEQGYTQETGEELDIVSLHKDMNLSFLRSQREGAAGCYPFENLRAAVDILFLRSSSDLVVAKQAIFLYYLFDRHWTMSDENWRHIIDDFAATFGITRNSLLESFIFYLLDDYSDEALQEACQLLPEICGSTTHPKIARVLLERQSPETALMVLRWSGRDDSTQMVSLSEAVTAVRVRVECALLVEAFTYQRSLCMKVKEKKLKYGSREDASDDLKGESKSWVEWMGILVTELCCLCIRRNWIDRMIELPWNSKEEQYLHKCLLDSASDNPSSTIGSLLVVFYLQRFRYIEAYQVHLKIQTMEENFLSENSASEEALSKMRSQSHWRGELVDKCIELLPAAQQQEVKTGHFNENTVSSDKAAEMTKSDIPTEQHPQSSIFLTSSFVQPVNHTTAVLKPSVFDSPAKVGWSGNNISFGLGNGSSSILHERLFTDPNRARKTDISSSKTLKFNDTSTSSLPRFSPSLATNKVSPEAAKNMYSDQFQSTSSPYYGRLSATPAGQGGLFKDSSHKLRSSVSGKRVQSDRDDGTRNVSSDDQMDLTWSFKGNAFASEDVNTDDHLRWRTDEGSDEEDERTREKSNAKHLAMTPITGRRRGRFSRRSLCTTP